MQQIGLSSINMVLIKKICKFFDKSLVFAYYFIKIPETFGGFEILS